MKKFLITAFLTVLTLCSVSAKEMWKTNWNEARTEAEKSKKPMMVLFTGSDWCPWCVKLDRELLSKPDVKKFVNTNFVPVKLDFPRKKELPAQEKAQNQKLAQEYEVQGFPTILYFTPEGKLLKTRGGYRKGGTTAFIEHLKEVLEEYRSQKK